MLISVSGDVNTITAKPVTVRVLESTTVKIPLKPTEIGRIPLEVTAKYKDSRGNEFVETSVVWVDVESEAGAKQVEPSPLDGITHEFELVRESVDISYLRFY